jgi:hypothetical protein
VVAGHRQRKRRDGGRLHPIRAGRAKPLFFQLVSSRYEHASLIVTFNCPSSLGRRIR